MGEREAGRARSVDLYGVTLLKSGDEAGAQRCFSRAQAIIELAYGPVSAHLAAIFSHQGDVLRLCAHDPAGARLRYLRALAILQHAHGLADPAAVEVMVNIGYTLMAEKRLGDAAQWFQRAAAVGRSIGNRDSPVLIIPDLLRLNSRRWIKPEAYKETLERETARLSRIYGSETAPIRDAQQYLRDYVEGVKRYEDMYAIQPTVILFLPVVGLCLAAGYIAWTFNGSVSPVRSALLPFLVAGEAVVWLLASLQLWMLRRARRGRPVFVALSPEQELAEFYSIQNNSLGFDLAPFRRPARRGDNFAQFAQADIHLMAERHGKAAELLTGMLAARPGEPSILCRRALAYLAADEPEFAELAISDLNEVTAREPGSGFAHLVLSGALNAVDRNEEAIVAASRALDLEESAEACYERGVGYAALGNFDAAAADLTRALELGTAPQPAHVFRGYVHLELGRHQEALADFTSALDSDPENAPVLVLRGTAYRQVGQYKQSLADLSRAMEVDPKYGQAYSERCRTYRAMGLVGAALVDISKAIELCVTDASDDPDAAELHAERQSIWHEIRLTVPKSEELHPDADASATMAKGASQCSPGEEDLWNRASTSHPCSADCS